MISTEGFDRDFYLKRNPDVAASGMDPEKHFVEHGAKEGRARNADEERVYWYAKFDAQWYLKHNTDVAVAGMDPFEHFIAHGISEGRSPRPDHQINPPQKNKGPSIELLTVDSMGSISCPKQPTFDMEGYLRVNPDVAEVIAHDPGLLENHWRTYGVFEGRAVFGLAAYARRSLTPALWHKKPAIACYGLFEAPSGMGTAARAYCQALKATGYEVSPITVRLSNGRFYTTDDTNRPRINIYILNADMMHLFFLDRRERLLDDSFNIGVWAWELAYFPSVWSGAFGALDEIWVTSKYCQSSISAASPVPVRLLPPPVTIANNGPNLPRSHFRVAEDVFVFGYIFDVGSTIERKNPAALIRAFRATFGDSDKVLLALKYHGGHHYPEAAGSLHELAGSARNIRFFGTVMDEQELASFKAMLNCVVSPHRGEGFGFNIAEAMLMEQPVIATDYSGSTDFFDERTGYPIAFSLIEVGQAGPYVPTALWADPDGNELSRAMREVFDNQSDSAIRAANARTRIETEYSVQASAKGIKERLEELGLFGPGPVELRSWGAGVHAASRAPADDGPRFTVVVPIVDIEPKRLVACVNSVLGQFHGNWELLLIDDGSTAENTLRVLESLRGQDPRIKVLGAQSRKGAVNAAIEHSSGEFVAFLEQGDEMAPNALEEMVKTIAATKYADLLYSDEDCIDLEGRRQGHYYKPDWSPENLESVMYLGNLLVTRRSLFLTVGGYREALKSEQKYDFALRASRCARAVVHVSKVLYHRRLNDGANAAKTDMKSNDAYAIRALEDHLAASKRQGSVVSGLLPGYYRVRDALPIGLPVTLVIFTDNRFTDVTGRGKINMFDHFTRSIFQKTETKCAIKILAVDNGNLSSAQRRSIEGNGGRVVSYQELPSASFNFARKANFAFRHIATEHFIMLNDDMEVIEPGWIDALMELAIRPTTGVVGARLLFPDGSIQHCGMVLGVFGAAAHVYHRGKSDEIGYSGFTHTIRNYSAVTGACMAMRTNLVSEIGGFDEKLAIDYNDTDFCLRAQAAGYRNIYTPFASLYHFEGKTAVRSASNADDQRLFCERWAKVLARDPNYNPNLSKSAVDFSEA